MYERKDIMLIDEIYSKLDDKTFCDRFIANPENTLKSEFGKSMDEVMSEISGSGKKFEDLMNKLASIMDVEFLTAAASSCCS